MVYTYNPRDISISWGNKPVTGFAEDTFVNVVAMGDGVVSSTGCDGEIVRNIDPNDRYTVEITLQQGSSSNERFSYVYKKDKTDGAEIHPLVIKDKRGNKLFSAQAWISKRADRQYGRTAGDRSWTFETDEVEAAKENTILR